MRRASQSDQVGDRARVVLPINFTLASDETTGARLRQVAGDDRVREIFVDGHQVTTVSVRALGLLVAVTRLATMRGALAVVIDPSPALAELITRLGLAERLLLVPGEDQSVAEPQPRPSLRSVPALN